VLDDLRIQPFFLAKYEPADADGPAIWTGTYDADGKDGNFDAQDIQDYVVDQKDGKSPPDGGRAAKQKADELSKWGGEVAMAEPEPEPESEPEPAPVAEARPGWYCTVDNDEWEDVTTACGVMSTEHREYFEWLKLKHKMGNNQQFKNDSDAVFFYSPLTMKNGTTGKHSDGSA
jgi:hypothetical protein